MANSNPLKSISWTSSSVRETELLAQQLAVLVEPGLVIGLNGSLGAGKTCFVRKFAETLGVEPNSVNSPTYVIVQHYLGDYLLHHFDLYRVESEDELEEIGAEELFEGQGICLVEWSNRFTEALPDDRLEINFMSISEDAREMTLSAFGDKSREILEKLTASE
jgi:tRNA threonylcarbamoyladenosine biosynthesis protein TsaE